MDTDALIRALASRHEPAPRAPLLPRLGIALLVGLAAGLLLLTASLGLRPDFLAAAPAVALKAFFSAGLAALALGAVARAARPGAPARIGRGLAAAALVSVLVAAVVVGIEQPGHRIAALTGGGFPWCVVLIPAFALPTALALVWAFREAAPTNLALAGALIGALSGSVGAVVYAGYCPVDSVAFVTAWYVAGIAVASALGALLGSLALRW